MNKKISLSLVCMLAIGANAQDLGTIEVNEKVNTKVVENISTKEVKNADIAEALAKKSPSISLIRRSGIANDIILRGQKRDNIKVTIDDGMICGACPNRMDPPTSHVITANIDSVEIKEGPFDVSEFGTLSGGVKIKTVQPQKGLHGEIGATIGSFGYQKELLSVSGGNDTVQALVTYSHEKSDQYEDGDGNSLAEQTYNLNPTATTRYADNYKDMESYEKQSIMAKVIANITDNQSLELSATQNRSDNILYPSTGMDAIYDDSNLYNLKYTATNLGGFSKKLEIKTYKTDVDHPMSTMYRVKGATTEMTNHLTTDVTGTKIINTFDALGRTFEVGIDTSKRNWDGHYSKSGGMNVPFIYNSIQDSDTKNNALFVKCTNELDKLTLEVGVRYDDTTVDTTSSTNQDREFKALTGNLVATYKPSINTKYFVALGTATRVPDARELYFVGVNPTGGTQVDIGTDTLKDTTNTEIDFGTEHKYDVGYAKAKFFYSQLSDYIYYQKGVMTNRFKNIDAKIYGMELSGAYYMSDSITMDAGYTYKVGKKDKALDGQTDTDLADITPPKLTLALTYDHDDNTNGMVELVSVAKWKNYDADNGEQAIDGYNIVNIKGETKFAKNFELVVGIDNLFDKTYAVSNTYADLTLLSDGTDVMLLNEPGRYIYTNLKYKF